MYCVREAYPGEITHPVKFSSSSSNSLYVFRTSCCDWGNRYAHTILDYPQI